jgi:DNA-binding GntR family transcriptional regulator
MGFKGTLSEKVYQQLKGDIIKGKYEPGSELYEVLLADSYKVSRTPVREALRRLEQDSIVRIVPNKGAVVIKSSIKDTIEITYLREVLEGLAARLAVRWGKTEDFKALRSRFPERKGKLNENQYIESYNLGIELHDLIIKHSRNTRLKDMIDNINNQIAIIMQINADIPGRYDKAYEEHIKILNAIINKDEDQAEKEMRNHIKNVYVSIIEFYGQRVNNL